MARLSRTTAWLRRRPLLPAAALLAVALAATASAPAKSAPDLFGAGAERTVFLGSGLSDEDTLVFTTAVAASGHPGVVLLDAPKSDRYVKDFLDRFRPSRVVPVGPVADGGSDLQRRLGV